MVMQNQRNCNNLSNNSRDCSVRTASKLLQKDGVWSLIGNSVLISLLWCLFQVGAHAGNVEGVDDSILFKMRWKNPLPTLDPLPREFQNHDMIRMMSSDKEPYVCFVPRHLEVKASEATTRNYNGPTPLELLEPLLANRVCRYKLDHYWTYQLCHGKSLRQYHEDTTSTKVHIVEFYLGKYDLDMMKADNEKYKAEFAERLKTPTLSRAPTVKIDGVDHPYFAVNMSYGTLCDINQRPRNTQVWYVCDQMSDHDVHSFEEPASCTYRVVVRTPYLCKHPDYRVEVAPENEISCHPEIKLDSKLQQQEPIADAAASDAEDGTERFTNVSGENDESCGPVSSSDNGQILTGNSPQGSCKATPASSIKESSGRPLAEGSTNANEPQRLREMVRENEEFRESALQESDGGSLGDDVKRTLKIFFLPQEDEPRPETPPPHDQRHVERFLSGDYCLQGGTGWWKYEFCYGKRVSQFHVEKGKRTQEILLGRWNQRNHRAWVDANPSKKVAVGINSVTHFYSEGDICEVTRIPRTVKVKLICKSIKGHPDAVSIFLQEPRPCEYTLTVESSIVCHVQDMVDDYGLPADETPIDNHYQHRTTTEATLPQVPTAAPQTTEVTPSRRDVDVEDDEDVDVIDEDTPGERNNASPSKGEDAEAEDGARPARATPSQNSGNKPPSGV
ncbi:endoplasmic reticulum lectin 1-like [Varroa destructor]|uniref:Endoplasmic reticulum lectin 1 n=1 Tax=Varroa destructor TaxID=109461 RepID=A0A7M7KPL6_VARDE|nr:endoplasmic reticulum lectin 1-like [Varroa destructor]